MRFSAVFRERRSREGRSGEARFRYTSPQDQGSGLRSEEEEGGRHTPFLTNYRPQFYFRTTDVTVSSRFPRGWMCMPGDNVEMGIELIYPVAMEKGLRFSIREGGRTVGAGSITEIIE
ncbi:MAG: hypothetical protein ACLTDS_07760 [Bianqueaceae bacterium]